MFNLIPYRRNENSLFHMFDDFERNFWNNSIVDTRNFRTDIKEKENSYELSADLPGCNKDQIRIDVDNNTLTISTTMDEKTEDNHENYVRRERRIGTFSRSFDISGIEADGITAAYTNGVLTLELPKKQVQQLPPSRQVQIQ